jgi:predicted DNA-binding transcriptional regulator AlpA
MKQIHNMQIAKSFSPDESPDLIPRSKKPEPITDPAQLPMALNAAQVAATLGISRAGAYNLMRSEGFPTLFIGKRMVVPKDRLLAWMNDQVRS